MLIILSQSYSPSKRGETLDAGLSTAVCTRMSVFASSRQPTIFWRYHCSRTKSPEAVVDIKATAVSAVSSPELCRVAVIVPAGFGSDGSDLSPPELFICTSCAVLGWRLRRLWRLNSGVLEVNGPRGCRDGEMPFEGEEEEKQDVYPKHPEVEGL